MKKLAIEAMDLLYIFAVLCVCRVVNGGFIRYNTGASTVEGKLNVHLVPHSHDDVGWLKTIDQYYVGSNNSFQRACVRNVLDSVVESLLRDPNRKFVFAEQAFFQRWWAEQNVETQEEVKKLVDSGQLEFINGGWCMHDEATCHYIDMIDQTTLGHRMIKEQFNKIPRVGWQIDPFGHSAVQAYLLGAELGFDSLYFGRIDYQDRAKRMEDKSLEVIWHGSKTFGSSSQIFSSAFPINYFSPETFRFEVSEVNYDSPPLQDNPLLYDYNIEQRVNDFIEAAMTQANVTRTNHIMWTMGGDFYYQYAESWFKQMDKLIHYVNKDGRVNALYSIPSLYTDTKYAANESWPLKTDDYFPYADFKNAYWTGFFTSRPALKRYVRILSGYYIAARQLEFMAGRRSSGPHTFALGDALGIVQHHDAVTGTAKQHTTDDYAKRLAIGASQAETVVNIALSCLAHSSSGNQCAAPVVKFSQCHLLNISYCPPTEEEIPEGKSLVVVAYNPLGWSRTDIIRIPVNDAYLIVQDSKGNTIEAQYMEVDNVTINLRNFYTKAYTGVSPKQAPKYWLLFQASVLPLGWNTYFISKASGRGKSRNGFLSVMDAPQNDTVEVGPGDLKMSFSSTSGQLERMVNYKTGVDIPIQQSYLWYGSSGGDGDEDAQASGAYIFRPNGSSPVPVSRSLPLKVMRGPLVDEVHQQFNSWIYQVTRLYKDKEHAEVEFTIGPIPLEDGVGKEVITRMTANMATDKVFYTDSNGRDFLKRIRGNYYMSINQLGTGARWRRTFGQQVYSPFLLAFTHENMENWKASHVTNATAMDPTYSLPPNIALITLQELDDGTVLLRLAHLYEAGEDVEYSTMAKVELKKMFVRKMIKEVKETSLSTNQDKSEMKRMNWKVEGDAEEKPAMRGGPIDASTLVVELGPMEIRTFLLKF